MKTPNFTVSKLQVLDAISDQISIDIVTAISNNVTNSDSIMKLLDYKLANNITLDVPVSLMSLTYIG